MVIRTKTRKEKGGWGEIEKDLNVTSTAVAGAKVPGQLLGDCQRIAPSFPVKISNRF